MIPTKPLSKQHPVYCELFPEQQKIICYGFDVHGILAHIVGVVALQGISIEEAKLEMWKQGEDTCFYNEFLIHAQSIDIQTQQEIQSFIERQGYLIFNNQSEWAKRTLIERIAEGVEMRSDIANLMPIVTISIEKQQGRNIELTVEGKDHPFVLYMICDALAEHNLSILQLHARTQRDSIRDVFLVQAESADIDIRNVHFALLLYIKFAYFIQNAANPYQAIQRLQHIIRDIIEDPAFDIDSVLDSKSPLFQEIPKILGSGDYVWEDFIKSNANEILKVFSGTEYRQKGMPRFQYESKLVSLLKKGESFEEKVRILNDFKNEQRYRVDIDALMMKDMDFLYLSRQLSELAKVVVRQAIYLVEAELKKKYGVPRSAAGIEAKWVLFGLGKFGGSAMGFASDLEVLFVYTDKGSTDGKEKIPNSQYFTLLLQELSKVIQVKKRGIFTLDFRLRPYGEEGALAVHIDTFIEYYRLGGDAHGVERLALSRLRPMAGNPEAAEEIISLRDEFIYFSSSIDPQEILSMRQKQIDTILKKGERNAKFGVGALLDVEIHVQLLQVKYGRKFPVLRQPSIYHVLQALEKIDKIDAEDISQIQEAYTFFRRLINALRLRRGNATDVSLPPDDDWELTHLARRMGYKRGALSTQMQICIDFDAHSANVYRFMRVHTGSKAVRMRDFSPAALVHVELDEIETVPLLNIFKDPPSALRSIQNCTKAGALKNEFARILLLSWQRLVRSGNADAVTVFFSRISDSFTIDALRDFYQSLLLQPERLFILLNVCVGSRYLSDEILKNPSYLEEICKKQIAQKQKFYEDYRTELAQELGRLGSDISREIFLDVLRDYKKLQTLRIITQDICLAFPLHVVFAQISDLAKAILQTALEYASLQQQYDGRGIAVFAFGKFGAHELNYSSDLDLLFVYTEQCTLSPEKLLQLFKDTIACLFEYTASGRAYRIDLRLQPYGQDNEVISLTRLKEYYEEHAKQWELQACIKCSCVAGDAEAAESILSVLKEIVRERVSAMRVDEIFNEIHTLRKSAVQQLGIKELELTEVKQSWGGLRDIEFATQGLQMLLYPQHEPKPDTLSALQQLREQNLISSETCVSLTNDYCFLRRIEHFLQVYDDKQLHRIPEHDLNFKQRLSWLVIGEQDVDVLFRSLHTIKKRVSKWYQSVIYKMTQKGCFSSPFIKVEECTTLFDVARDYLVSNHEVQEGTVFCADQQTKGRGTKGRRWVSEHGKALLILILVRTKGLSALSAQETTKDAAAVGSRESDMHIDSMLPVRLALAVAQTLQELPGPQRQVEIKWPNDVLIAGKKVAGILIEQEGSWKLLGIGLNVKKHTWVQYSPRVKIEATSLEDEGMNVEVLECYERLRLNLETQLSTAGETIAAAVNKILWQNHKEVEFLYGMQRVTGRVRGISDEGFLILDQEGQVLEYRTGEIIGWK